MALCPDQIRQLAPAGPAQDPTPSPQCSEPLQPTPLATCECAKPIHANAHACLTAQAASVEQMHHPSQQAKGPVVSQIRSSLAAAAPSATTSLVPAPVSEAPTQEMLEGSQQQQQQQKQQRLIWPDASVPAAMQPHASPTLQKQALQAQVRDQVAASPLPSANAVPQTAATSEHARPDAALYGVADAVLPAPSRATPWAGVAEARSSRDPPRGQAAEAAAQQGSHDTPSRVPPRAQASEAAPQQGSQATPSRAPPRGHAAKAAPQQGSQARHAQQAASRSSRNVSRDRNASGTRMSLRSHNPAPDKAIRKASSSSRSGRVRSASDVRAPAYATR